MKKVELHLHLDGSVDVEYASKKLGYDVSNEMISINDTSLKSYLEKFDIPGKLLQDYDNIVDICEGLGKTLEKDEVIYAEVRFCPLFHLSKLTIDEVVAAIKEGFAKVPSVKINLIFCMMRHFSFEENLKVIEYTKRFLGNGVCAIDLAGDEAGFKTKTFDKLFEIVRNENIPFTIHAGEADGFESVRDAVSFGAKRIGHGIHSIENEEMVKELVEKKVTLEVCPKSNLDTMSATDIKNHPIKKLMDNGVLVTISTDNRTVSGTSLEYEYKLLKDNLGFTDEDLIKCNLNAINCAFISEEEKDLLRDKLLH